MKVIKKIVFILTLVASTAASAADYDVRGISSDADAGLMLKDWMADLGYRVDAPKDRPSVFLENEKGGKLVLVPKVSTSGVDRLIIYKNFKGKPSNVKSEELRALINEINASFNVCSAYLDSDGDLSLRYNLLFDDKLSPRLLRVTLEHVDATVSVIISKHRDRFRPFFD